MRLAWGDAAGSLFFKDGASSMWRWLVVYLLCTSAWAGGVVTYPSPESKADRRNDYAVELLRLALQESGGGWELRASQSVMNQDRAFADLKRGGTLRVAWAMTSTQRELQATPIRIPIYKGLIGWRLPLVHASQSGLLAQVSNLNQLKRFTAGQAREWPDTQVLEDNGLRVVSGASYEGLFNMLAHRRFDYFPRSIVEVWDEARERRSQGIMVDQNIALYYPAAVYFFVNNNDPGLAEALDTGLERAIADGKFDRLFYSYFAGVIEEARLNQRRTIELVNPNLPLSTPLSRKELWLLYPKK
jgi:hypothetical protein